MKADDYNILAMTYSSDKLSIAMDCFVYDEEEGTIAEEYTEILTCSTDGSDLQRTKLEKNENSDISRLILLKEGSVLASSDSYKEDNTDPENPIYEEWEELTYWNVDGTIRWVKKLYELRTNTEDYLCIRKIRTDSEGNIYLLFNDNEISLLSPDGNIVEQNILVNNVIVNINNIYFNRDNKLLILHYNEDRTKLLASKYDPNTGTLGEMQEVEFDLRFYNGQELGTTTDLILSNSSGIYSYNIGDMEIKPIMNFINSDFENSVFLYISMIDETHFAGAYRDRVTNDVKIAVFTKVNPEDIPDKDVLVLGVNYLDSDISERVVDFNKKNAKYRITIRDYSLLNTMEDDSLSYTQRNQDIVTGNMPDILVVDRMNPVTDYISKGLIADIGELIEKDEELSQEEFMENVFEAYSVNDKLYYIVPSFCVTTAIAKKSIVGERTGWTMDEMLNIEADLPEGSNLFDMEFTKSLIINYIINNCGSDFIDVSTGKCKFDSEEFIKILEFANNYPHEVDSSIYDDDSFWAGYDSQYREKRTVVMPIAIYIFSDMIHYLNGYFDGDCTFVGYPNENSNGSSIMLQDSYVISAQSPYIDGAWEFLRYYLTDEYQKDLRWGLPVNKEYFLEYAQEATKRNFYIDEDGNKIEEDYIFNMNGESFVIEPLSQEQVDDLVSFIESVNRPYYYNNEVLKIVIEETSFFFSGQKDAKDVAGIIQNRVQLYVNEHR